MTDLIIRTARLGRDRFGRFDVALLGATSALVLCGLVAIASTTGAAEGNTSFVSRQLVFVGAGVSMVVLLSAVDYRRWRPLVPVLTGATVVVLLVVLSPIGTTVNGTKGWIRVAGFSLQPAEFAKLTLIAGLAALLSRPAGRLYERLGAASDDPRRLMAALGLFGVVSLLVLAEGETGSVLVYAFVAFVVLYVAGAPNRILVLLVVSGLLAFGLAFTSGLLGDHVADRFTAFLDAEADPRGVGYHQIQSVTTIGSGGLFGEGLFAGPQTQFGFLPEKQTDFIFAAVGEEAGFVGVVALMGLYTLLLRRLLVIARRAPDRFGQLLVTGVFGMILFQVVQNVGMTIRVLPITGIPLPFLSYGGSSLLTTMIAIGLAHSVALRRSTSGDEPSDGLHSGPIPVAIA